MNCRSCPRPLSPEIESSDEGRCRFCVKEARGLLANHIDAKRTAEGRGRRLTALGKYNEAMGYTTPAQEERECVSCHRTTNDFFRPYHKVCGRCQGAQPAGRHARTGTFFGLAIHDPLVTHETKKIELTWPDYDDEPL